MTCDDPHFMTGTGSASERRRRRGALGRSAGAAMHWCEGGLFLRTMSATCETARLRSVRRAARRLERRVMAGTF